MTAYSCLRIATRKSPLALWQANHVAQQLEQHGYKTLLVPITTTGDKLQKQPLRNEKIDASFDTHTTGKGLFVKEIQEALLEDRADLAVHSMKDLPVDTTPGLTAHTTLARYSPEDVLITPKDLVIPADFFSEKVLSEKNLSQLLSQLTTRQRPIGTVSARRKMLLKKHLNTEIAVSDLRGNVDTRLTKLEQGDYAGIILARAGLERLQRFDASHMFSLNCESFVPAPAQGTICIETRLKANDVQAALQKLNDIPTLVDVALERLCLWLLGGDCHTAIGVHKSRDGKLNIIAGNQNKTYQLSYDIPGELLSNLKQLAQPETSSYQTVFDHLKFSPIALALKQKLLNANFSAVCPQSKLQE